jgi:hypothetical protein
MAFWIICVLDVALSIGLWLGSVQVCPPLKAPLSAHSCYRIVLRWQAQRTLCERLLPIDIAALVLPMARRCLWASALSFNDTNTTNSLLASLFEFHVLI